MRPGEGDLCPRAVFSGVPKWQLLVDHSSFNWGEGAKWGIALGDNKAYLYLLQN